MKIGRRGTWDLPTLTSPTNRFLGLLLVAALLAGCRLPGTIPQDGSLPEPAPAVRHDPFPTVRLPQDAAPHQNLTEWWYYTGHLDATDGAPGEYGFEMVVFQILRGSLPPVYVSHFAVSDITLGRFRFSEKTEVLPKGSAASTRFDLRVGDWTMAGAEGQDSLRASMPDYAVDLKLAATKPPALHNATGLIGYGPAGYSYYYSRTRMTVQGSLMAGGSSRPVRGEAWMDHQWGDFITLLGGGWDWFSFQLDDGSEYMFYEIRDQRTGQVAGRFATRILPDGRGVDIPDSAVTVTPTSVWKSPHTGASYPAGWEVTVSDENLRLTVTPKLADQELLTQASTGVSYWEGAVTVSGARAGQPLAGRGYVELTGYASGN